MPRFFFDTSAFTKRYHIEVGSARVASIFEADDSIVQISNLGILEAQSAFGMKVRTGQITEAKAISLRALVLKDVSTGVVEVMTLDPIHFAAAALLVSKYGFTRRMRTLDALQLAVALDLHAKGLLDIFVVADKLLPEVAVLEGLSVQNPDDLP